MDSAKFNGKPYNSPPPPQNFSLIIIFIPLLLLLLQPKTNPPPPRRGPKKKAILNRIPLASPNPSTASTHRRALHTLQSPRL